MTTLTYNVAPASISNRVFATPTNPTGTTSTTYVMQGLAIPFTPVCSGNYIFQVNGISSNSGVNGINSIELCYGGSTAPINGAAIAGGDTVISTVSTITSPTANAESQFSIWGQLSNLIISEVYWLDLALLVSANTGTLTNISVMILEI